MRISVAICTYNGEAYLRQQLTSIIEQIRIPDELIIVDDASTDATVDIVKAFADTTDISITLSTNAENIGSTANFDLAISKCTGDIIVLADQDDVWKHDKLAKMEYVFLNNPDIGLVFSDAEIVNNALDPLGWTMWQEFGLDDNLKQRIIQQPENFFAYLLRRNLLTGATIAFQSHLRPLFQPISQLWIHDHWIGLCIASQFPIYPIDECLILYRQHTNNQIGARTMLQRIKRGSSISRDKYQQAHERTKALFAHFQQSQHLSLSEAQHQMLCEKLAHTQFRADLPSSYRQRWFPILKELYTGMYQKYSPNGYLSAIRDMIA